MASETDDSKQPRDAEEWFIEGAPDHLVASEAGSEPVNDLGRAALAAKTAIFGRRLSNAEEGEERLPKKYALPIFSSDAISSSAYASEEILIVLASSGASYLAFGPVVALAVGLLLGVVAISYRQVCFGFPKGGGAYAVASSIYCIQAILAERLQSDLTRTQLGVPNIIDISASVYSSHLS